MTVFEFVAIHGAIATVNTKPSCAPGASFWKSYSVAVFLSNKRYGIDRPNQVSQAARFSVGWAIRLISIA